MEDEVLQGIGLVLTVFLALVWFLLLRKFNISAENSPTS